MLTLLLTLGCTPSDNTVKVHQPDLLHFEIDDIQASLWLELASSRPDDGWGRALLAMTDGELNCDTFKLLTTDTYYGLFGRSSVASTGDGIVVLFTWWGEAGNAGWEGIYPSLGYSYTYDADGDETTERSAYVLPFSDGMTYLTDSTSGLVQIEGRSADHIQGAGSTSLLDLSFSAEDCGQQQGGFYYDSGR
jgi:hypothetical protein